MSEVEAVPQAAEASDSLQGTTEALAEATADAQEAPKGDAKPDAKASDENISGKLGTLLRREQQYQAKVKAEKTKLAQERETLSRERAEIESLREKYARIKDDPIEGLKETGLDYEKLTRNILNAGTPEAKMAALEKKLEAFEQARQQEIAEQQQRVAASQIENGKKSYQDHIAQNEAKYPTLALYDEGRVRDAAWQVAMQYYQETKIAPEPNEVAEYLEQQALAEQKSFEERRAKRTSAGLPPEKAPKGTKTLTSAKTKERSAPALPDNYSKLSKEEQRKLDVEFLEKNLWKD